MVPVVEVPDAPTLLAEVIVVDLAPVKRELVPVPSSDPDGQLSRPLVDRDDVVLAIPVPVANVQRPTILSRLQRADDSAPDTACDIPGSVLLSVLVGKHVDDSIGRYPDVVV